jgi:hypothetical protein
MTQQEIFQNMTKLPWFWHVQGSKLILTGEFAEMKVATMNVEVDDHTNVKAIESAVNNTYGKGINPESVEKMKQALELCEPFMHDLEAENFEEKSAGLQKDEILSNAFTKLKEALTAAKL